MKGRKRDLVFLPYIFHIKILCPEYFNKSEEERKKLFRIFQLQLLAFDFLYMKRDFHIPVLDGDVVEWWLCENSWLRTEPHAKFNLDRARACITPFPLGVRNPYPQLTQIFEIVNLGSGVQSLVIGKQGQGDYFTFSMPNSSFLYCDGFFKFSGQEVRFLPPAELPGDMKEPLTKLLNSSYGQEQNPEVIKDKFIKTMLEMPPLHPDQIYYCLAPGAFFLQFDLYFLYNRELKFYTLQSSSSTEFAFFGKKQIQGTIPDILTKLFPGKDLRPIEVPTQAQVDEFILKEMAPI